MIESRNSLTEITWSADLASQLADCASAISRLDVRVSVSSLGQVWMTRASFAGFAAALRAQHIELEEIDVFCINFGLKSDRKIDSLAIDCVKPFSGWIKEEALSCPSEANECPESRHWNENLPFIFEPPPNWESAPMLIRALEIVAIWSRSQPAIDCWLAMPAMLQQMKITTNPLPCLAGGDPALRYLPNDREANLRRSLKRLKRAAEDGEALLNDLEKLAKTMSQALSSELRPKRLRSLALIMLAQPTITPKAASECLDISLSGAGKLLSRAHNLGFVVPLRSVDTWKTYVASDMALRLRMVQPTRGRPPINPLAHPHMNDLLSDFEAELSDIDTQLSKFKQY